MYNWMTYNYWKRILVYEICMNTYAVLYQVCSQPVIYSKESNQFLKRAMTYIQISVEWVQALTSAGYRSIYHPPRLLLSRCSKEKHTSNLLGCSFFERGSVVTLDEGNADCETCEISFSPCRSFAVWK